MQVALVVCGSLDTVSGGFLYDRQLVSGLRRLGHRVEVVELPWRSYPGQLADGLRPQIVRQLTHLEADIVLQDELCHPSLLVANRWPGHRPPIVAIVHHLRSDERAPALQRLAFRWAERAFLASVDACVFNTRATQDSVERLLGRPMTGVVATPAGDHLAGFGRAAPPASANRGGPLRLLFVGNLIPRKGLDTLLTALESLPPGSWQLDVVGRTDLDTGYSARLLRQLSSPGWREAVRLWGPLMDVALADRYRQANLLVVPSEYEGFGIVYLEAMGHGLPVIASRAGGASELVEHGVHGFLVPPRDPAAIRQHLQTYLAQPSLINRQGAAALDRARSHPTWSRSVALVEGLLQRLAADPVGAISSPLMDF